ncbi:MAG TPA: sigma 54 modulation/S30EA ribosomal C-terminal domain-containing protein, partial [Jatrophihabitans sp.]
RFRNAADRRRIHHGRRNPASIQAVAVDHAALPDTMSIGRISDLIEDDGPGRIVREKQHPAVPMTVDEALSNMELVGHDFYMFMDKDSGLPAVVYRRHAYDYGLIRLAG